MKINMRDFHSRGLVIRIRSAIESDAEQLSILRIQIDGETENLDRESGEGVIDIPGFRQLIYKDTKEPRNLFLIAEIGERIVGFSRCEGNHLNRFSHKVDFGVCVLKEFWGYGIGKNLLKESLNWADMNHIIKVSLSVLESNKNAIQLYSSFGFEIEGILKNDRKLSDEKYYNTILMGRVRQT